MSSNQSFRVPALLGTFVLAGALMGCGQKSEQVTPVAAATPEQLQIVKEETRKRLERVNQQILAQLESRKKESVDGEGRIFHHPDQKTLVIYKNLPVANLRPIPDMRDDDANQKFLRIRWDYSRSGAHISDEELRQRVARDGNSFYRDSIDEGSSSVVKLASGRVCEENPLNNKREDCFSVKDIDPKVQLAKDIALAKRKLGLQLQVAN